MMNLLSDNEGSSLICRGELQDLKLFVWNVRGAGSKHFSNELKEHLRLHRPQIVALLETHICGDRVDKICQWSGYDKWHRMEAQGFQGGM